jgi:hypothetical protein
MRLKQALTAPSSWRWSLALHRLRLSSVMFEMMEGPAYVCVNLFPVCGYTLPCSLAQRCSCWWTRSKRAGSAWPSVPRNHSTLGRAHTEPYTMSKSPSPVCHEQCEISSTSTQRFQDHHIKPQSIYIHISNLCLGIYTTSPRSRHPPSSKNPAFPSTVQPGQRALASTTFLSLSSPVTTLTCSTTTWAAE